MRLAPSRIPGLGYLAAAVAGAAATYLMARDFPAGNNVYHLPLVLDYASSVEGPHDLYHQSFSNFISFFWAAVARVATEDNIRPLFLGLLIACSALSAMGAYAVATAARASRGIAAVGAAFLAFAFAGRDIMEFGGGELFSTFLTHSQFATALCLFSAALALRDRWRLASLVCGLAADCNLFLGFWLMVTLLIARAASQWRLDRSLPWRDLTWMSAICLVACAPTIVWALSTIDTSASAAFSYTQYLYSTFPFHSFVHLELWNFLAFAGLVAGAGYVAARRVQDDPRRLLATLLLAAGATLGLGALLVYASDDRMIQNLMPLRYAAIVHWLAAAAVIASWSRSESARSERAVHGAVALLGFAFPTPAVTLLGLALLLPDPATQRERRQQRWIFLPALACSLLVPALSTGRVDFPVTHSIGPVPSFAIACVSAAAMLAFATRLAIAERILAAALVWLTASATLIGETWVSLAFACAIPALYLLLRSRGGAARRGAWAAVALAVAAMAAYIALSGGFAKVVLGSLVLMLATMAAIEARRLVALTIQLRPAAVMGTGVALLGVLGFAQAARQDFDFPRHARNENWSAAQAWARSNTPPDTVFYSPDRPGFATLSRRPLWFDENDFAAVMWKPSFHSSWSARRAQAREVHTMDELLALARREEIGFLVLSRKLHPLDPAPDGLALRYCDADFCIGEVKDTRMAQRREVTAAPRLLPSALQDHRD